MTLFAPVNHWRIPGAAMVESLREMSIDGTRGNEGVAFWLGHHENGCAVVTHVVLLRGSGVIKRPYQLTISPELMNDLTDVAIDRDLTLIGQIHSHSPRCSVDFSPTDHAYGVRTPYFLSLVAPDFALRPHTSMSDCGVHLFEENRGFRRLTAQEIAGRIVIASGAVEVVIVGEAH